MPSQKIVRQIASELSLSPKQVDATLALFGAGNTLPFIARYRKEATGGLDEVQLRDVRDRGTYLVELDARREAILGSIEDQGKLTAELRARIVGAETKQGLEDLYLPYKPKRRTRATIARERGLEPLADAIWSGGLDDAGAERAAPAYVDAETGVESADAALQGARDILAERVADDADLRGWVRDRTRAEGVVVSRILKGKGDDPAAARFRDYFEFSQKAGDIPSHRMLAIRRGEAEEVLTWAVEAPAAELVAEVTRRVVADRPAREQLARVAEDAYRRLLSASIQTELRLELKERADADAIEIFGRNLDQLLLGAPAGERAVLGLDPGFRTGVKAAVVSRTGAVLDTATLYLHQEERFAAGLRALIETHRPELLAIGNGTASRETEQAARKVVSALPRDGGAPAPRLVLVNESGASVYSASDVARDELPDLDVSLRGAVSIARRLQDPLAELVKIDPKSIGVGQYQHDVDQPRLRNRLDETVTVCVNRVGVELNTASPSLLSYVAGLGPTLARNIVAARDAAGGLRSRKQLLGVPRLGPKAFEQAAGFLRLRAGDHPLDRTAVHPERYALVERMAKDLGLPLEELVENEAAVARIDIGRYVADDVGRPTLTDILDELRRPGRDPRDTFEAPAFREDVTELKDLKEGMRLEGVVTNVVAFGAFVDVGVHQDGLVHVSQLADRFVKDPADVVGVGQKVQVTVLSVDLARNRIGLSMRDAKGAKGGQDAKGAKGGQDAKTAKAARGTIAPNGIRFS
ncbi:MAG TPA: Tex family protein [Longimicrobiales bacterium]|nr:Tex family protein [Longimicrobiales bacterium]